MVRESGLLERTPWFYIIVGAAIALGFGAAITAFILLGDSWVQHLVAGVFGILVTQVAFHSPEAAHRTILSSGRANDTQG
ncbi:MAG TPA: acyl-CoA desaturase, partial [Microbacterium sp.]|nr:acyl-CoA desaturase [Microbacterium sp.]